MACIIDDKRSRSVVLLDVHPVHSRDEVVDALGLVVVGLLRLLLGLVDVEVFELPDQFQLGQLLLQFLLGHVLELVLVLVQLQFLLEVVVSLNVVQELLVVHVVLLLLLFLLLGLALLHHHAFVLQLLQLEHSRPLLVPGQSDQGQFLIAVEALHVFCEVELGQVEAFHCGAGLQVAQVAPHLDVDPLVGLGDIVAVGPFGVLVEGRLLLLVLLPLDLVAVQNLEVPLVLLEGQHLQVALVVVVLGAGHQHVVEGVKVDEAHVLGDLVSQQDLPAPAQLLRQFLGDDDQVVFADAGEGDGEGVLVGEDVGVLVVGDELLGVLDGDGDDGAEEVDEALGVGGVLEVEVDAVVLGRDLEHLVVDAVPDDELLHEVEGLLVVDVLAHLHHRPPGVRGELLLAVVALHVHLDELHHHRLLHLRAVVQLLLDRKLHLDPLRVRLCPDEPRVYDPRPAQPSDFFEEEGEEFLAIALAVDPGRAHVAVAEAAEVDEGLLGDAEGDVAFGEGAVGADVAEGGGELDAAHGAENARHFVFHLHC